MSANKPNKGNHHQPALFRATNTKRKRTSDDVGRESKHAGDGVQGVGEGVNVASVDNGRVKEEEGVEGGSGGGVSREVKDREREGGVKLKSVDKGKKMKHEGEGVERGEKVKDSIGKHFGNVRHGEHFDECHQSKEIFLTGTCGGGKFKLFLPSAKQPVNLPISEPERSNELERRSDIADDKKSEVWLISQAVHEGKSKTWSKHHEPQPLRKCDFCDLWHGPCTCNRANPRGALNSILKRNSFPLNQGPLIIPLDDHVNKEKISTKDAIESKTMFKHSSTQECFVWTPIVSGVNAWNPDTEENYTLKETFLSAQGPVSNKTMGLVYTCNMEKCVINCPCSVCCDERKMCKLLCRIEVCDECNSQCLHHQIKLPRLFNPETDHYTLITNKMDSFKYAIPYAGIPVSCSQCTNDVLEHQRFHLVFHTRCRYCRHDLRPFERKNVVTLEDYEEAENLLKWCENRTCSYCLIQCVNKVERIKHEETVHKNNGKYKCESCTKTYSNSNALNYHISKNHSIKDDSDNFQCEVCKTSFSAVASLRRHNETAHNESNKFECKQCGENYSREHNLKRHLKENHFHVKANLDFVEDFKSILQFKCKQCVKSFKRKDKLNRHISTVHSDPENNKKFECTKCDKKYTRSDALRRHFKDNHNEESS